MRKGGFVFWIKKIINLLWVDVQSMNLNVPERPLPANLMREGAVVRILDSHSEVEYTKPPDYLQVHTF